MYSADPKDPHFVPSKVHIDSIKGAMQAPHKPEALLKASFLDEV